MGEYRLLKGEENIIHWPSTFQNPALLGTNTVEKIKHFENEQEARKG